MSIFFITDQTTQRPNIEIKQSLVSLLTTQSFLERRLTGIISRLAMEKVPKRRADQATKRNIKIQSAGDFYAWASSMESLVEYKFVGKEYCEKIAEELKQQTLKPIPGTMKLHSVVGNGDGVVHV